jgi:hypothetical protein
LEKNNIKDNVIYFPPIGFSKINNIVPIQSNANKKVDILFMGSVGKGIFSYRCEKLELINKFSIENGYIFECYDVNLFDTEKDEKLKDTKIVIHIPSYENLNTFPWAKAAELMCKKVFFIIEKNPEMEALNIGDIVAWYDPNIQNDLIEKIKYYLTNDIEREIYIEKCYNYIKNNYDMDKFLSEITF